MDGLLEPIVLGYEFLESDYVKHMSRTHLVVTNLLNKRPIRIPIFKKIAPKMPCLKRDFNNYLQELKHSKESGLKQSPKHTKIVNNIFVHKNKYEPLTKDTDPQVSNKGVFTKNKRRLRRHYAKQTQQRTDTTGLTTARTYGPNRTLLCNRSDLSTSSDSIYTTSSDVSTANNRKRKCTQKTHRNRSLAYKKSRHRSNTSSYTLEYLDQMKMNGNSDSKHTLTDPYQINEPRHRITNSTAYSTKDEMTEIDTTNEITNESGYTELTLVNDKPLSEKEFLNLFDLKHLDQDTQIKLHTMFLQNKEIFALHKWDIGKTNILEMDIDLKTDEERTQTYIRIPDNIQTQVQEILDQLTKYDIIRICDEPSQFTSNILVTRKKDGSIRLLFDGRLLNHETKQVAMASITKPEILSHIAGKKYLSSLDFADAFFHIPLSKKAQPLTTFFAYGQRLCFTRAPQGLKNSPSYLKSLLDITFYDMTDSILFYADDLLIATDGTLDEHFEVMREVLKRLKTAGLKLRPQKMLIVKQNIEFLGLVFTKDSINIPQGKIDSFKTIASPKTPKKCKSIVACLSFYRNFLPNFAELSREIMELSTLEQKQFKWTCSHESKLRHLIKQMCQNTALHLPLQDEPFFISASSTEMSASGTLLQIDENGKHKIICANSRTFTKTERNYSKHKKNILALVYTLKSNDYFVKNASNLTVLMDTRSLIHLKLAKESSGILLRLSLEIMKYDFKIGHLENPNLNFMTHEHNLSKDNTNNFIKRLTTKEDFEINEIEDKTITKRRIHYPKKPRATKKDPQEDPNLKGKKMTNDT